MKRKRNGRRQKPDSRAALGALRTELAQLERIGADPDRAERLRGLIRASERALLVASLGGAQGYNRLVDKYGHERLWKVFSDGVAHFGRGPSRIERTVRWLLMRSRRLRLRLERLQKRMQEQL